MKMYILALTLTAVAPMLAMEKSKQLEVPVANARALEAFQNGRASEFIEAVNRMQNPSALLKPDINYQYPQADNITLLAYACVANRAMTASEYEACLRCLLEKPGVDGNLADTTGYTPLMCAMENPDPTALRILMEYKNKCGLDFNKRGRHTALTLGVMLNRVEHIKLLLRERSVDLNLPHMDNGFEGYPLRFTVNGKCLLQDGKITGLEELTIMRDLAECGADVECKSKGAMLTPLGYALKNPTLDQSVGLERIAALLALGADIRPYKNEIERRIPEIAQTLTASKKATGTEFILHEKVRNVVCLRNLIELAVLGGDDLFSALSSDNLMQDPILQMTAFMWAAARGNLPLAKQLAEHVTEATKQNRFTRQDRFGYTALHFAALNDHPEMVKFILSVAPDLRIVRNNNGRTPLDIVIRAKKSDATLDAFALPGDKKLRDFFRN